MKTLKALGALLTYPSAALVEALPDIHAVIVDEGLLDTAERRGLKTLMQWMSSQDPLDLEEAYVATFDRGRATSLHLFEHVHGDSRDRGQAMVDLGQMYERAGLQLVTNELPDFLPAMLEFASLLPVAEARDTLADCGHIVRSVGESLRGFGSPYDAVFAAILNVAKLDGLGATTVAAPAVDEDAMDREWAEQPAFGPGTADGSCSAAATGRGCGTTLPLKTNSHPASRAA